MGKALHPKVCGCGSTSFTKEKQGKPWYCESCELGFCTKCGEWPLLTGSDKSCGVCIAQQAYPDCTGCFVYDEITNVSLLQHHGNTCPVHEDKPEPTKPNFYPGAEVPLPSKEYEAAHPEIYGAVNTHHNPHVDDGPIEALCCSYHWPSQPASFVVSQAAECVDCGHIGHQVQTVSNTLVVHHEDADLEDDHDFLLPMGYCPACGQPNNTGDDSTCLQCHAVGITKCHGCGSYIDGSDLCIVCAEINGAEEAAELLNKPKCEVCKATIHDDLPVAHWKCSKAFQKETCLCGAFDFQQPNDDLLGEKAIVCGKCGLTYCAQGCTALIVNTNNEFCDLHMVKDDDAPFTPCAECHTHVDPSDMTFKSFDVVSMAEIKVYKTVHKACVPTHKEPQEVVGVCSKCGDPASGTNGVKSHILCKAYDHDVPNLVVTVDSLTKTTPKTLFAKILAEMKEHGGENVVAHTFANDSQWGKFTMRCSIAKTRIYVDYHAGDNIITLMCADTDGHILVEPPLPGTYDLVGKQPSLVRYNWVFKRYGIPFRVAHKDGFWILRHANTAKLGSARVFQNEKGNPCTLTLVQGS